MASPDASGGFLARHFRGDYGLGRSYWGHMVLVSLIVPWLAVAMLPWVAEHHPARQSSIVVLVANTFVLLAWLWGVVGTWRAARRHVGRGGRRVWAVLAQVAIVFGVLKTVADVVRAMPSLREHARVAAGVTIGEPTRVEIRADGRSVLLAGGINDGSAEQLEQALSMAPSVTTVVLSSQGGWIREGEMIAEVIRRRGLGTYIEGECSSACTIAFLAGRDRAAAPSARIGFHASRGVGSRATVPTAVETSRLRTLYRDAGLGEAFVGRALETPNTTMWYPSHDELQAARVLTRRSLGGETAAISTALRTRDDLLAWLRRERLFEVLERSSTADFDAVAGAAWATMRQGGTDAEVIGAARARLADIVPSYIAAASDQTLLELQALALEELEALRLRSAEACVELVFPSGRQQLVSGNLPRELGERETALVARAISEADATRARRLDAKAIDAVHRKAAIGLTPEQQRLLSDPEARRRAAPLSTCNAAIRLAAGLYALPPAERGPALRLMRAVK